MSIFGIKQTWKIVSIENCKIWNFHATRFVYISMKSLTIPSRLLKMLRYWDLKETKKSYEQRSGLSDNQWQNVFAKVRKSNKIGIDQRTSISAFA